jgi:outer membrane protein
MKHRILLTAVFLLAVSVVVQAQDKKIISLAEAIDLGIRNSKQLKLNQAKIDEAHGALQEAIEKKLPSAGASASYLRLNSANIDVKSSNNNNNGGSAPKVNQALYGILNVSLPIYSGGRIRYGIESARFLEKAVQLDAEKDKDEVVQNTIEAFSNLFKAGSAVRLVKENLAQSEQRVKDLSNLEKNGLLARNDLLKAQLQSSTIELNLLDAENNLQMATLNMNLMLGLPDETQLVPDTNNIQRPKDERVMSDFEKAALENRKDIAATDFRKKAAESGVKSTRADMLPSVQLTGGYIAADIPKFFTVTNAVNIGVGVSYNIASLWKTKSKIRQAEARVTQLQVTGEMLSDQVKLQVDRSYLSLLSNRKKIEVYAKALEQANENYRIVKNKFENSLATTTELLEADVAQLQARLNYTLAQADAFVAYNKLLQSAGILAQELKK